MTESPAPAPALADADADGIATVHELIKGQRTAMLTTHHADGSIVTRPTATSSCCGITAAHPAACVTTRRRITTA